MLTIGVIGDFGISSKNSLAVSNLVKSWNPQYILTTGDNLYAPPTEKNYSKVVGGLYKEFLQEKKRHEMIKPSKNLLIRSNVNKKSVNFSTTFLPCVGNHDYPFDAYIKYFRLPTYYSAEFLHPMKNLLKVISLNSDQEIDGKFNSVKLQTGQKSWLEKELEDSVDFKWIIISFHHPQLCSNSSDKENEHNMRSLFPFHKYRNVALILCGHQHIYERLEVNRITNVVVGTSGSTVRRKSEKRLDESKCMDDCGFGALKLEITDSEIRGTYYALEVKVRKKSKTLESIKDEFLITPKSYD